MRFPNRRCSKRLATLSARVNIRLPVTSFCSVALSDFELFVASGFASTVMPFLFLFGISYSTLDDQSWDLLVASQSWPVPKIREIRQWQTVTVDDSGD